MSEQKLRGAMAPDPLAMTESENLTEADRVVRDRNITSALVADGHTVRGIWHGLVTDTPRAEKSVQHHPIREQKGTMSSPRLVLSTLAAAILFGCQTAANQTAVAPQLPPAGPDGQYEQPLAHESEEYPVRRIDLDVGAPFDDCGLTEVHFFYDARSARPQAHPKLEELAECLNSPPQREVDVLLVGRADPRGPAAYNEALGAERAEYVKERLIDYGVAPERLKARSVGERGAKGGKEAFSYGYDRRVDVVQIRAVAPR